MPEASLRGALIGAGQVALEGHLPGWLSTPGANIVAGTDTRAAQGQAFQNTTRGAHWYPELESLLAHEALNFVDICTPPATHAALIEKALNAGLHVLCEKPLVLNPARLQALIRLARRRECIVHSVHNWHRAPIIGKLRRLLRTGIIGSVRHCAWRTLRSRPAGADPGRKDNWRLDPNIAGGGIWIDHGWHALYLVNSLLAQSASAVSARFERRRYRDWPVEDTATVQLRYPQASAEIFLSWACDERSNSLRLDGSRGTLDVEGADIRLRTGNGRGQIWHCGEPLSAGSYHPRWFAALARDFIRACRGEAPDNLAEAGCCVQLINLAQCSSRRQGEWLEVPANSPTLPPTPIKVNTHAG